MSRASRVVGALGGLGAGYAAVQAVLGMNVEGKWVMPIVAAVLAYGCVSALFLFFLADLVVQPKPPVSHFPQAHR
jgi:hypothetical protein